MNLRLLMLFSAISLLSSGCMTTNKVKPIKISTDQNSPVRIHVYDWPEKHAAKGSKERPLFLKRILILPPLGLEDPNKQRDFHEKLYSAAQRRFKTPLKLVMADSSYAPYVTKNNLVKNDGTINAAEVAFIGALMNSSHVICPYIREMKPYHPQRIDINLMLIEAGTGKVCAEFTGVLDARESDIFDYFIEFSKMHKTDKESTDDLRFRIKSPNAFQAFTADMCCTVMAERLSL